MEASIAAVLKKQTTQKTTPAPFVRPALAADRVPEVRIRQPIPETISVVDLDKGAQTGLVRFTPLPFNSNAALVTPSVGDAYVFSAS